MWHNLVQFMTAPPTANLTLTSVRSIVCNHPPNGILISLQHLGYLCFCFYFMPQQLNAIVDMSWMHRWHFLWNAIPCAWAVLLICAVGLGGFIFTLSAEAHLLHSVSPWLSPKLYWPLLQLLLPASSAPDWVSLRCYTDMSDLQVLDEECWWGWFCYISVKWWSTDFVEWFVASSVLGIWHINVVLAVQGIYINPGIPLMGRLLLHSMSRLLLQLSMF